QGAKGDGHGSLLYGRWWCVGCWRSGQRARVKVVPAGADVQRVVDQLIIVFVAAGEVDVAGIDDQQWCLVVEMEEARVGIVEAIEVVGADALFGGIAAPLDALQQYIARRLQV